MLLLSRRHFLQTAGAGAAALALAPLAEGADEQKGFTLPKLPYEYNALERSIDKETMQIHHDLHHKAYVDNLNKALAGHEDLLSTPIEDLLRKIDSIPENLRTAVRNQGGGHANHSMFWLIMGPDGGGKPSGELAEAIDKAFESFDKFRQQLSQKAIAQFGSGWGWLVLEGGTLKILSTPNQDSPLMKGQTPILGIDVWEHAYYLRYHNRRPEYVAKWWDVVNWEKVAERYDAAKKQG